MVMSAISLTANLAVIDESELGSLATLELAMHAATVATLTFSLIGAIVATTGDYRFGRIDQLLLTSPRPLPVLAAKSLVGAAVGLLYALCGSVVALVTLNAFYGWKDVPVDLASTTVIYPLIGAAAGSALFGAIGVGAGTAIRNQPVAVAGALVLLMIVQPPALLGIPEVGRWLPGAAGLAMTYAPDPELLSPLVGGMSGLLWTAVALLLGWFRLTRDGAG